MFRENSRFIVMILADGVSTCRESRAGARIACAAAAELLLHRSDYFFETDHRSAAAFLLSHTLAELQKTADAEGNILEEYSSTLACVLIERDTKRMLYFSLGDSLIMGIQNGSCRVLAMPSDSRCGCCVTTTQNAASMMNIGIADAAQYQSVLLCSDGAWHLMYNRNRLNSLVKEALEQRNYHQLEKLMKEKDGADDYSYISLDLEYLDTN